MTKRKLYYTVSLEYELNDIAEMPTIDARFTKRAKAHADSSGMGLGKRDLAWHRQDRRKAIKIFDRLCQMPNIRVNLHKDV